MIGKKYLILLIEDDEDINRMVRMLLERRGYLVCSAYSGTEGMLAAQSKILEIDLIILDLMLPGIGGEAVVELMQQKTTAPIIVMSAITDVDKKVEMFSKGAVDYISKPFDPAELLARVNVRIAQSIAQRPKPEEPEEIVFYDLTLDCLNYKIKRGKHESNLTKIDFQLLKFLMINGNRVCPKAKIFYNVWDGYDSADDNTLNVHISTLRKKLREIKAYQNEIETIWGIGYRLKHCGVSLDEEYSEAYEDEADEEENEDEEN